MEQNTQTQASICLDHIVKATCTVCQISEAELRGRCRDTYAVRARQLAATAAQMLTNVSLGRIGGRIGRNHTTVIHSITALMERLEREPELALTLARIEAEARALAGLPGIARALPKVKLLLPVAPPPPSARPAAESVLDPLARRELFRLVDLGWSPKGLMRRYELTREQLERELQCPVVRAA